MSIEKQNQCIDYLIDPSFQGINRLFVLSFEDDAHQTRYTGYFLPKVEIKNYNVMTDGQTIFDQSIKNDQTTYDNTLILKVIIS